MNKPTVSEKVVPPKIALLLKKKGFDWKIANFYMYTPSASCINSPGGYKNHYRSYIAYSNSEWAAMDKDAKICGWKGIDERHPNISAPTYDMVVDWLCEKGVYLYVTPCIDKNVHEKRRWLNIYINFNTSPCLSSGCPKYAKTRYEALNYGILQILKNKIWI